METIMSEMGLYYIGLTAVQRLEKKRLVKLKTWTQKISKIKQIKKKDQKCKDYQ